MNRQVFRLPDLGEGTVSAEIVAWHVKPGDLVREDQPLVEMSTDKAVVEIPSPCSGRVVGTTGKPGDVVAVGAELATFDLQGEETAGPATAEPTATAPAPAVAAPARPPAPVPAPAAPAASTAPTAPASAAHAPDASRVRASPATRRRAQEAGIDLARVAPSGPGGRVTAEDVRAAIDGGGGQRALPEVEEVPVIGIRRVIAQRMIEAVRNIPHFSYVEEVDVTELMSLRARLNSTAARGTATLTPLPFIVAALVRALADHPQCNAHYDATRDVLLRYRPVHVGIATQTGEGLKVPVVRDAGRLPLRALAAEISRVTGAARDRTARRQELSGSTITVTSLGKLGGIVSTPIINMPEVAIIGINRVAERPMVVEGEVRVRQMMNLSSSFDHRFVDGADAAALIQRLKELLEHPSLIFIDR